MSAELVANGICKRYGEREVLSGVSFRIAAGEAVALVGPSGAGKSTLLNILGSLDLPDSGTVNLAEIVVTCLRGREMESYRNRQVGFLFQEHHLLPQLSALENVLVPTLGRTSSDAPERAMNFLKSLDLQPTTFNLLPSALSGGERQRVALARALINDPPMLLCDEPTGNLDQATGDALIGMLVALAHERGKVLLVVTHNEAHAARFDRVLTLCDGRLT